MKPNPKSRENARELLARSGSFHISLNKIWGPHTRPVRKRILEQQIKPLLFNAENCIGYGMPILTEPFEKRLAMCAQRKRNKILISDPIHSLKYVPDLWEGTIKEVQRSLIWSVNIDSLDFASFFSKTYDPCIARNERIAFHPAAWTAAHDIVKKQRDRVVFMLPKSNPLDFLSIIADIPIMEDLLCLADMNSKRYRY